MNDIDLTLHVKHFAELTTTELYEIIKARFGVFYLEQAIRYPDLDDVDYQAVHIFLTVERTVVAYARLYHDEADNLWHAGRVLTLQRLKGHGRQVMEAAERYAHQQGATLLHVNAQLQAEAFYQALGYQRATPQFIEANLPHVGMRKTL